MTHPPSLAAPFPYFGGKRRAASLIWEAFGDPGGYVEPFAGSAAVLLARPAFKGRRVETINDADGWLVNTWRAIQLSPDEVARHAAGPVTEIDYHARLAWLQGRRTPDLVAWLEGDPEAHDPKAAGWWLYVAACGIGDPWGGGPWRVIDGRLQDARQATPDRESTSPSGVGANRKLPHLGNAGQGVHRALPHLGDAGQGVHRALPHLGNAGRGVHLPVRRRRQSQAATPRQRRTGSPPGAATPRRRRTGSPPGAATPRRRRTGRTSSPTSDLHAAAHTSARAGTRHLWVMGARRAAVRVTR